MILADCVDKKSTWKNVGSNFDKERRGEKGII